MLLTDWEEFLHVPWDKVGSVMRNRVFIDGRNMLQHEDMQRRGFTYVGVGRSTAPPFALPREGVK